MFCWGGVEWCVETHPTVGWIMKAPVSLSLPTSLKRAAEDFAEKDGVSLNQYVARAVAEKIGSQGAEFFAERGKNGDAEWAIAFLEGRPE